MKISDEYIEKLQPIYRDILSAFPQFNPTRKFGYGLAYPSLHSALDGKYNLGEIRMACENMAAGGAMKIEHQVFANPTPLGEELIAAITRQPVAEPLSVPPFPPLPVETFA